MQVKVNKYLFIGHYSNKKEFVETAQSIGIVQFDGEESKENKLDFSHLLDFANHTIDLLPKTEDIEIKLESINPSISIIEHINNISSIFSEVEGLKKEVSDINKRISIYQDLGIDSILKLKYDLSEVGIYPCLIYVDSPLSEEELNQFEYIFNIGNCIDKTWYIVWLYKEHKDVSFKYDIFNTNISLEDLYVSQISLNNKIQELKRKIYLYASAKKDLKDSIIEYSNEFYASECIDSIQTQEEACIFHIEGYVGEDDLNKLDELCDISSIVCRDICDNGEVPTKLHNEGDDKIGEDIVYLYDVPASDDKDPSRWVLIAFSIFYGMIVGDAGYGLIQLIISMALLKKYSKEISPSVRRSIKLFAYLGVATIIWGLLIGNVFGIDLAAFSITRDFVLIKYIAADKLSYVSKHMPDYFDKIKDIHFDINADYTDMNFYHQAFNKNYNFYEEVKNSVLFEAALVVGIIHVILGMCRDLKRKLPNLAWIFFLISSFFVVSEYMKAVNFYDYLLSGYIGINIYKYAYFVMIGSLSSAVAINIFLSGITGIFEILNVVQIFSDIMSYLRLYALGISGGIMAATFNSIGYNLGLMGIPVIIIGHVVNVVLCIMGGAIHGTRLNFLEWFRYCFDGGGSRFNPLKKEEKEEYKK